MHIPRAFKARVNLLLNTGSRVEYVHYNPVKHGLTDRVSAWPYSTFHRDVAMARTHRDWGVAQGSVSAGEDG